MTERNDELLTPASLIAEILDIDANCKLYFKVEVDAKYMSNTPDVYMYLLGLRISLHLNCRKSPPRTDSISPKTDVAFCVRVH